MRDKIPIAVNSLTDPGTPPARRALAYMLAQTEKPKLAIGTLREGGNCFCLEGWFIEVYARITGNFCEWESVGDDVDPYYHANPCPDSSLACAAGSMPYDVLLFFGFGLSEHNRFEVDNGRCHLIKRPHSFNDDHFFNEKGTVEGFLHMLFSFANLIGDEWPTVDEVEAQHT